MSLPKNKDQKEEITPKEKWLNVFLASTCLSVSVFISLLLTVSSASKEVILVLGVLLLMILVVCVFSAIKFFGL